MQSSLDGEGRPRPGGPILEGTLNSCARVASTNAVAMPIAATTRIQKIAPGPPSQRDGHPGDVPGADP